MTESKYPYISKCRTIYLYMYMLHGGRWGRQSSALSIFRMHTCHWWCHEGQGYTLRLSKHQTSCHARQNFFSVQTTSHQWCEMELASLMQLSLCLLSKHLRTDWTLVSWSGSPFLTQIDFGHEFGDWQEQVLQAHRPLGSKSWWH